MKRTRVSLRTGHHRRRRRLPPGVRWVSVWALAGLTTALCLHFAPIQEGSCAVPIEIARSVVVL